PRARKAPRSTLAGDLPTTPPLLIATWRNPRGPRISPSSGAPEPANTTSAPRRLCCSSSAIAIPGHRCPPVPPPAITIRSTGPPFPSGRVLRDVQQHPEGAEARHQAGAAVAQERQRDSLGRHH